MGRNSPKRSFRTGRSVRGRCRRRRAALHTGRGQHRMISVKWARRETRGHRWTFDHCCSDTYVGGAHDIPAAPGWDRAFAEQAHVALALRSPPRRRLAKAHRARVLGWRGRTPFTFGPRVLCHTSTPHGVSITMRARGCRSVTTTRAPCSGAGGKGMSSRCCGAWVAYKGGGKPGGQRPKGFGQKCAPENTGP
jgi:hypothetical protein